MSFTETQLAELKAPLAREHVKEREQSGRKLSYIEGWTAIAEANRIFGFDAWDRETVECKCVAEREAEIGQQKAPGWRVAYITKVRITVRGAAVFQSAHPSASGSEKPIVREGTGYGSGIDRDLGAAHESAIKEAETDAMKRALMTFGNAFGLALYDKTQAEVEPKNGHRPPPARSEEDEKDHSRKRFASIRCSLAAAPSEVGLNQILSANKNDIELIKKHGGDSAFALLHDTYQKRLDELRETAAA